MDKKRILMVDDEPDILTTTKYMLEDEGYEVHTADNGEEGIEKLKEVNPDLILLDLMLPGKDGFQIAREIKAIAKYKNIPVVAVTSRREDPDKYIAVRSGFAAYIEKPIDIDKLLFDIKELLSVSEEI